MVVDNLCGKRNQKSQQCVDTLREGSNCKPSGSAALPPEPLPPIRINFDHVTGYPAQLASQLDLGYQRNNDFILDPVVNAFKAINPDSMSFPVGLLFNQYHSFLLHLSHYIKEPLDQTKKHLPFA